jgi:hypothetical protein
MNKLQLWNEENYPKEIEILAGRIFELNGLW